MSDWERAIAGHRKVEEAFAEYRDSVNAADTGRIEVDRRIAAILELILMRLDRIEAKLSNGGDNVTAL